MEANDTKTMSRDEQTCLLYLETCAVDYDGFVESIRMNAADFAATEEFKRQGLVEFQRVPGAMLGSFSRKVTHYVTFTPAGWALAHRLRIERAERGLQSRRRKEVAERHAQD